MRHFILLLLAISILGCSNEESYTLKGTATGFEDGTEIYLQELGPNNKRIALDTAIVAQGRFSFYKKLDTKKVLQVLNAQGVNGQLLLVQDPNPLDITLFKDSIGASIVKGSMENELFNTYRNESRILNTKKNSLRALLRKAQSETDGVMVDKYVSEIKEMDAAFITDRKAILEQHSDKMVSIAALSDLINAKVITAEETESFFKNLSDDVQKSPIGSSIDKYVAQQKAQKMASKLASVGNKAPEFSALTPEGKELSLSETLGEYTIIDFWASWCKPCRMENPNVVRVYKKYHDKGLNIISVSLDRPGQKDRWIKAIEKDQMDWYHISNLQYWQDPIPRSYGVRAIPATFLLDKDGVIIAKNLRGRALEAKMDELLGS
jgi:thiol-disulfide isomerase/thioredoxin